MIEYGWIRDHLADELLGVGPYGLEWWQWGAILVLLAAAWAAGRLLSRVTMGVLRRVAAGTATAWNDALPARAAGPIAVAWGLLAGWGMLPWLDLPEHARALAWNVVRAGFLLAFFWALFRAIGIVHVRMSEAAWARSRPAAASLVPLVIRALQVAVFAVAAIAVIAEMGYPVAGLLAGLGIGGLAIALASQKTVENLFGSLSIGVDQPLRLGDFVRVEDVTGTVESIGLRSTRIRTPDRTVVTIPNGKLADMRIETFAVRDRIRLACTIGIEYGVTAARLRALLEGLDAVLRSHPKIWPDVVVVRLREFAASSIDVEVVAWFQTTDWAEFLAIRQEVLLSLMDVVEKAGARFALPARRVHMEGAARP
ncbi:MAG: mechanosensitive ion channel family protein [Myxococcota bacterium]|nr:mechanosensitive ion channel family protein [Myxococcota bacterium]